MKRGYGGKESITMRRWEFKVSAALYIVCLVHTVVFLLTGRGIEAAFFHVLMWMSSILAFLHYLIDYLEKRG